MGSYIRLYFLRGHCDAWRPRRSTGYAWSRSRRQKELQAEERKMEELEEKHRLERKKAELEKEMEQKELQRRMEELRREEEMSKCRARRKELAAAVEEEGSVIESRSGKDKKVVSGKKEKAQGEEEKDIFDPSNSLFPEGTAPLPQDRQ